jgi:lysine biosynthesis protein LysW
MMRTSPRRTARRLKNTITSVTCINCRSAIKLGFQPIDGQILICAACGAELEVINDRPLELALYSEDWDDDGERLF